MKLWENDECVKKSEINSKNHCGGREIADETHTSGSITVGEHWKKLAIIIGRDPIPTAGGVKKKRLFGLGSEAESYFGKELCAFIERVGGIRVQEGAMLDPPPTNDDDVDS
ncbi:uncharacterized protein LOC107852254 [Capsicum annuum]|uniref:uncharacterized protein LOC107852254 n=1 Tax=Capsicum annuum TaxID=4072 RepID=UPI0007BF739D|nr:uncharacterized protein LOC107852254 [Capsicum annuum]